MSSRAVVAALAVTVAVPMVWTLIDDREVGNERHPGNQVGPESREAVQQEDIWRVIDTVEVGTADAFGGRWGLRIAISTATGWDTITEFATEPPVMFSDSALVLNALASLDSTLVYVYHRGRGALEAVHMPSDYDPEWSIASFSTRYKAVAYMTRYGRGWRLVARSWPDLQVLGHGRTVLGCSGTRTRPQWRERTPYVAIQPDGCLGNPAVDSVAVPPQGVR